MAIDLKEAEELLKTDVAVFERGVKRLVKVPLTQGQYDALVVFAYNIGLGALQASTLMRLLNDREIKAAAEQFLRWDKVGEVRMPGLTRRRKCEQAMFLGQNYSAFL